MENEIPQAETPEPSAPPTLPDDLQAVYTELPQAVVERLGTRMHDDGFTERTVIHDAETHFAAMASLLRAINAEVAQHAKKGGGVFWSKVRKRAHDMTPEPQHAHFRRAFILISGKSPGDAITQIMNMNLEE